MTHDEQIKICREWLRKFGKKRKTENRHYTAYTLKAAVEQYHLREYQRPAYIHLHAFVDAARLEGYRVMERLALPEDYFINVSIPPPSQQRKRMKAGFKDVPNF